MQSQEDHSSRWARVAGLMYVMNMVTAMFTEFFVKGQVLVSGDGGATLANMAAHASLWRLGVVADILTYCGVVLLIFSLYNLLRAVSAPLARVAAGWRLLEVTVMLGSTLVGLQLLQLSQLPSGPASESVAALAVAVARTQATMFWIGLAILGLGSGLFNWLLLRSGLLPTALARLGVAASAIVAVSALLIVADPDWIDRIFPWCFLPIFIFEVTTGALLLWRGVGRQSAQQA